MTRLSVHIALGMNIFGDLSKSDKLSPFVQLLWEKGNAYEQEVVAGLDIPFLDSTPFGLFFLQKNTS